MYRASLSLCAVLLFSAAHASAQPLSKKDVPAPLKPWESWVLWQQEERLCPFLQGSDNRLCAWPTTLGLNLNARGGRFTQRFRLYAKGWVSLPGDEKRWPQDVKVDGVSATVTVKDGEPRVFLRAGEHAVTGTFSWSSMPESLAVPSSTGLVALTVAGKPVPFPIRDEAGTIWLQGRPPPPEQQDEEEEKPEPEADKLDIVVYRKVSDGIPIQLTTRIELTVAGKNREVLLGQSLPDGFIPMTIQSPIPSRLESGSRLRVQLRPGNWAIEVVARASGPETPLTRPAPDGPWREGEEIWVFDANSALRVVEVEQAVAIDTEQTTLPDAWKRLPAYAVVVGQTLKLVEKRRGDPDLTHDALSLSRQLWLDFNGRGYTIGDEITGRLKESWRLDMSAPAELGRVSVAGRDQFINSQQGTTTRGVEVRQGLLKLTAESRLEGNISDLPAVGWNHDFDRLSTVIHLPPGWKLFHASGADDAPGTWIQGWGLAEISIALLICLVALRFYGVASAVLAVFTLALTLPEQGAPKWLWIAPIACEALIRFVPGERLRSVMKGARLVALAVVAIAAGQFASEHLLHAIHPVLERSDVEEAPQEADMTREEPRLEKKLMGLLQKKGELSAVKSIGRQRPQIPDTYAFESVAGGVVASPAPPKPRETNLETQEYDPKTIIQTGPGLPDWSWRSVRLNWRGYVDRSQRIHLILLSPNINRALAFLRVALIASLLLCFWRLKKRSGGGLGGGLKQADSAAIVALGVLLVGAPLTARAEYPDEEMLEQLRERLLAKPECAPNCASASRLLLEATPKQLRARLEVTAAAATAIPLPGNTKEWLPRQVLVDGRPATALMRESGYLWIQVSPGRHQLTMEGALPERQTVQIELKLKPHQVRATVAGWELKGLHEDGLADESLELSRQVAQRQLPVRHLEGEPDSLEAESLPPFMVLKRTLKLGVKWEVETQVDRLTPVGSPVALEVPLLPGESVTSAGVRVVKGKVLWTLAPQESTASWRSSLEQISPIRLIAPKSVAWTEIWRLDVGPVWHVALSGIPATRRFDDEDKLLPEWHPWPGEGVTVDVSRPSGAPGQTLTIDSTKLELRPGLRDTDTTLTIYLRSSRASQHPLLLPEGAELQSVTIDGTARSLRQEGRTVRLPISPGSTKVVITWKEKHGMAPKFAVPSVDVGAPSVNAQVELAVPPDRWILALGGPAFGPTILFWNTVLLIALVAVVLGRARPTPLRTISWLVLGLGLSQVGPIPAALTAAWFFLLNWRKNRGAALRSSLGFDLVQISVFLWTLVTLLILAMAVYQNLFAAPQMEIVGNGSHHGLLRWLVDRTGPTLPTPWMISLPMYAYHIAMLAWTFWLVFSIRRWWRWAWEAFTSGGAWRSGLTGNPASIPTAE